MSKKKNVVKYEKQITVIGSYFYIILGFFFLKESLIAFPQHHFILVHEWEVQYSGMLGSVL